MNITFGQSQFVDTFFVAQAHLTPYRQMRQIELQISELTIAIKRASINERKMKLEISELDASNPKDALRIEEIELDLSTQTQLLADAESRLLNFQRLKEELIMGVPQEYWDRGFEAAEADHWVTYYSRQMAFETLALGRPSMQSIQQVSLLPYELQKQIHIGCEQNKLMLAAPMDSIDAEVKIAEPQVLPSPSKEA